MIRFCCPRCGRVYDAPVPGIKLNCPCGQRVQAPPPLPAEVHPSGQEPGRTNPALVAGAVLAGGSLVVLALLFGAWALFQEKGTGPSLAKAPQAAAHPGMQGPGADLQQGGRPTKLPSVPIKLAVPPPPEPVAPGSPAQPAEKNIELPPFPDLEKPPATHKKPARPSPQAGPNFILPFDALGPAEALDRIKGVRIRGKAHFVSAVNINDITVTWQSIQRLKYEEKTATPLRSMDTGVLLKASQAWYWHGRQMRNLEGAGLTFYQNFAYSLALSNLLPLKEKGFDLEKEEAAPVRDQECYRIRVRAAGRPEMLLFFDRKTNLLCKTQFRGPFMTVGLDGNVQPQAGDTLVENYFGEYRKVRDVNHWWKWEQYRDGLKYGEINLYNVEFLEKIEEGFFSLRPLPPPPTVFRGQLTNLDPFDRRRPGSRCKVYPLQLTAGKTYQIDMVSNQLDSYLRLEDAGGRQLAEDDDGGGFPNARIIFRCEQTGNYRITCTTFAPATGSYTLTVQETGR